MFRTMNKWFVEVDGQVEGPYTTEAIHARVTGGNLQLDDQIWGRAMEEWRTIQWWQENRNKVAIVDANTQIHFEDKTVIGFEDKTQITLPAVWHYAYEGTTYGPLAWPDLLQNLKTLSKSTVQNLLSVSIWTQGMRDWTPVTEFHDIMDGVGVNKRESPRASLTGRAVVKVRGNSHIAPVRSVSEGGFGTDAIPGVISGEEILVEIQSPDLLGTVQAKAEVRYVTDSYVGFKFTSLDSSGKGLISQYVRQKAPGPTLFAKAG
jgi:hypothetical protein